MANAYAVYTYHKQAIAHESELITNANSLGITVGRIINTTGIEGFPLANVLPKPGDEVWALASYEGGVLATSGKYISGADGVHVIGASVFHGHCENAVLNQHGEAFAVGATTEFTSALARKGDNLSFKRKAWGVGKAYDLHMLIEMAELFRERQEGQS